MIGEVRKVNGVYMICYPGGISGEIDRRDSRFRAAIEQLENEERAKVVTRPSVASFGGGHFEPMTEERSFE